MSEDNKLYDAQENCIRCGHPFDPHLVIAYDVEDFSKGGLMKCPIEGCDCVTTISYDFK